MVQDLNGLTEEAFLEKVQEKFTVEKQEGPVKCEAKSMMGMFLNNQWYILYTKPEFVSDDPAEGLDVAYLQRELLDPILDPKDPKTDGRISFVGGIRGLGELEKRDKKRLPWHLPCTHIHSGTV